MSNRLLALPKLAWTDYTPTGPWADGTVVTRNADGIGFTYNATLNALLVNPNKSASIKNANSFIVQNLPTPSVGGDAANKAYVDSSISGIPTPPSPSTTVPAADSGSGAVGTSAFYARGDHVHPLTHPIGCGRFQIVSATQVQFAPFNGDLIKINGVVYSIPNGTILANNTSTFINGVLGNLAAQSLYYVYCFNNSGTLALDFSSSPVPTTSGTPGNVGVQIKSGDDTRSLVGMVYTNASSQFQDATTFRGVLSWFNRVNKVAEAACGNNTTSSVNATYVQMGSANAIVCSWGEEILIGSMWGQVYTSTNGVIGSCAIGVDSVSSALGNQFIMINDNVHLAPFSYVKSFNIAQGAHNYIGIFYASLNATASTMAAQNVWIDLITRG